MQCEEERERGREGGHGPKSPIIKKEMKEKHLIQYHLLLVQLGDTYWTLHQAILLHPNLNVDAYMGKTILWGSLCDTSTLVDEKTSRCHVSDGN